MFNNNSIYKTVLNKNMSYYSVRTKYRITEQDPNSGNSHVTIIPKFKKLLSLRNEAKKRKLLV